jgi:hypothetical protein
VRRRTPRDSKTAPDTSFILLTVRRTNCMNSNRKAAVPLYDPFVRNGLRLFRIAGRRGPSSRRDQHPSGEDRASAKALSLAEGGTARRNAHSGHLAGRLICPAILACNTRGHGATTPYRTSGVGRYVVPARVVLGWYRLRLAYVRRGSGALGDGALPLCPSPSPSIHE